MLTRLLKDSNTWILGMVGMMVGIIQKEFLVQSDRMLKVWESNAQLWVLDIYPDELDGLVSVEIVQLGEVSRLLDDAVISVQRTGYCIRSARVMTASISGETHVARTHVMRVGNAKVMVKPRTVNIKGTMPSNEAHPCLVGKYCPFSPTPRCHLPTW